MTFKLPLSHRQRVSERRQERYRTDEAYRLSRVNEARVRRGQHPLGSVEEIGLSLIAFASTRQRIGGRFA